jgi:SPP1 gp7 family putative phage head morphogenesis protein
MNPSDWTPRQRIENEYRSLIDRLLQKYFALPDSATLGEITEALVNFGNVSRLFEDAATYIASRMATQLRVSNARSWREAARVGSRGREIYNALRREMGTRVGVCVDQIVRENAQLISSIPFDVRESVNNEIARMEREGLRPEAIAKEIRQRVPELTKTRARLIARTETSKAATALTQARSEDLGIEWGQWITSKDARVRPSHRNLDNVLMRWSDPPQPEALIGVRSTLGRGVGGEFPNCRCDMLPLITLESISWPAKIYMNGSIRRMTRGEFRRLNGAAAGFRP